MQCSAGHGVTSSSLLSLDPEALSLVLSSLTAADVARLGLTCTQLWESIRTGQHAAQLWRSRCTELLGDLVASFVATSGSAAKQASTWYQLYSSARSLDAVHWSAGAPSPEQFSCITNSTDDSSGEPLLARYGHTATPVGTLLVLVGGMLRDGAHAATDVSVLDLVGRRVIQPRLVGRAPPALRHMCTALVTLQQHSLLHSKVMEAVQAASSSSGAAAAQRQQQPTCADAACSGHTLLLFGGLAPDDSESGGRQLHVLWLAQDATWGVWLALTTSGNAPEPRAYACCQAVSNGHTVIVYGGWANGSIQGTLNADVSTVDGYLLLCIYLLDVNSLAWKRQPTRPLNEPPKLGHVMVGPSTCPGPRKQAMCSSRISPTTGHEEFVVLGGCGSDGLADFVPYVLDLVTFTWRKGPVMGYLPASRDAATLMRLSDEWLLLLGGKGLRGEALRDVQRLHLPSLSWKPPPRVCSSKGAAAHQPGSDTADFSAACGVVVGGSREGPYGALIMPRLEVLLPGPPIPFDPGAFPAAVVAADASLFQHLHFRDAFQPPALTGVGGLHQQQRLPAWMAGAGTEADRAGCRCGSCCSCLARRAAGGSCCQPAMPGYPGITGHSSAAWPPLEPSSSSAAAAAAATSAAARTAADHLSFAPLQCRLQLQQQQQKSAVHNCVGEIESEIEPAPYQPSNHCAMGSLGATHSLAGTRADWGTTAVSPRPIDLSRTPGAAAAAAAAAAGAPGGSIAAVRRAKQWHGAHQTTAGSGDRPLLQLLAALAALALGLLLVYPSMMLQNTAIAELSI